MSELYTKNCKDCGGEYVTENERQKFCSSCKARRLEERRRKYTQTFKKPEKINPPAKKRISTYNVMPIRQFVSALDRYNRYHGTKYSYGQVMLKLSDGTIKKEEFYGGLSAH